MVKPMAACKVLTNNRVAAAILKPCPRYNSLLTTETSGNTRGALALGLNVVHVCVEADASSVVTLHVITWISSCRGRMQN